MKNSIESDVTRKRQSGEIRTPDKNIDIHYEDIMRHGGLEMKEGEEDEKEEQSDDGDLREID
jgi:hypothetical protein